MSNFRKTMWIVTAGVAGWAYSDYIRNTDWYMKWEIDNIFQKNQNFVQRDEKIANYMSYKIKPIYATNPKLEAVYFQRDKEDAGEKAGLADGFFVVRPRATPPPEEG